MVSQFTVETRGQGLLEITGQVQSAVEKAKIADGLCTVFVRHTTCPATSRRRLRRHPYLWEHRRRGSRREVVLHIGA
jgi:thiamine phosphate synthase YjbQ (UPF0047 family)